jgi:hypothetical protein
MRDRPSSVGLLQAFADFYRTQVLPALPPHLAYHGRVAANVLDIVRRELSLGRRADESELQSLRTLLLQSGGGLESLNKLLCERIARGDIDLEAPALAEHLWCVTLDKLAIDQPGYSAYQRESGKGPTAPEDAR